MGKGFWRKAQGGPLSCFAEVGKCDITMLTQEAGEPPVQGAGAGAGLTAIKSPGL